MIGHVIGRYTILEKLGEGGMGVVYKARDNELGRFAALKILREGALATDVQRKRVRNEARAASVLNHPNIVTVYEILHDGPLDCIVMEYIDGQPLHQLIPANGLPPRRVLDFALPIASALAAAHEAGIVHRDLKPQNILVTAAGVVKIVDFGLAKPAASAPVSTEDQTVPSPMGMEQTGNAVIAGTPSYMSPEQVEGKPLNGRSDVFSFGIMLYELALGTRPFDGDSAIATMGAILHSSPNTERLPSTLRSIVEQALRKRPEERQAGGKELHAQLASIAAPTPRRAWQIPIAAALMLVLVGSAYSYYKGSRSQRVRARVPGIPRLAQEGRVLAAFDLFQEVERIAPDDPRLPGLRADLVRDGEVKTNPPGAQVFVSEYTQSEAVWRLLGVSPLKTSLPIGRLRWKFVKGAFETTYEVTGCGFQCPVGSGLLTVDLIPKLPAAPEMAAVHGAGFRLQPTNGIDVSVFNRYNQSSPAPFQVDRYEVTNRQFKQFLDVGGYLKKEFWKHPFRNGQRTLNWYEAMKEFVDATGQPGPSTWEAGGYPAGKDDFPVSGVSWYEAAAYAEFVGKSLPTVFHWLRVANLETASHVANLGNYLGAGPARVGEFRAESPYGTYDMAGNVKEWCWNEDHTGLRFVLGGAWKDQSYQYTNLDAQSPFDRRDTHGFRCVRYTKEVGEPLTRPIVRLFREYSKEKPASEEAYRAYTGHYLLDRKLPKPVLESAAENHPDWTKVRVVLNAAYGKESFPVYLFLPKSAKPPYQVVVLHPGAGRIGDSATRAQPEDFLVRSGRAFVYPVVDGAFERNVGIDRRQKLKWREGAVRRFQDIAVTLNYLGTRSDIDNQKIAYEGNSLGANFAPIVLAMEPRFKVAILLAGGLGYLPELPESDPMHFAPRVRVPVLMLNGRYDYTFPLEISQKPLFRLLGTPEKDKKHVIFDSAHGVQIGNRTELIREVLQWLDRYLGPVQR